MKTAHLFFWISLLLLAGACELEDPNAGVPVEELFAFAARADALPADSTSTVSLEVELLELSDAEQQVTFSTERGSFVGADPATPQMRTVTTVQRVARVELRSSNVVDNDVRVFARIGDFEQSDTVRFERAFPSLLKFRAIDNEVPANRGTSTMLILEVFREEGQGVPSTGLLVNFEAIPLNNSDTVAMAIVEPFEFTTGNRLTTPVSSENEIPGRVDIAVDLPGENGPLRDTLRIFFE